MPRFITSRELILSAREEPEVERLVTEALGHLAPEEVESLPPECRYVVVDRRVDIHSAAVALLQCDLKHRGEEGVGELLRQLAELFSSASVRISQIRHSRFPA